MGKMNLARQFYLAIDRSFNPGANKHSLKRDKNIKTNKIYSYEERKSLISTSAQLAEFIKVNYPEVKKVKDISAEHINSFLESKKDICTDKTLNQYKSRINKLEKIVNKGFENERKVANYQGVEVPLSTKAIAVRTIEMKQVHLDSLREYGKSSKSAGAIAVELSARFGLRVSETTKLQARDIIKECDKTYLKIVDSKGKRTRIIEVNREDDKQYLNVIYEGLKDNQRLVPIRSNTVNTYVERAFQQLNIIDYKDARTSVHAIRKSAAQNFYDDCRSQGYSIEDSKNMTSTFLGHGSDREDIIKIYVSNIH